MSEIVAKSVPAVFGGTRIRSITRIGTMLVYSVEPVPNWWRRMWYWLLLGWTFEAIEEK